MRCTCQGCGRRYRVDLVVSDELWNKIRPLDKPEGAGLLCGICMMARIEGLGEYGALVVAARPAPDALRELRKRIMDMILKWSDPVAQRPYRRVVDMIDALSGAAEGQTKGGE